MTERTTYVDVVDGDQLSQGYFNGMMKYINSDVEGSSASTDETEIATVQVAANKIQTGILILADLEAYNAGGNLDVTNVVFYLRIGTSATVTSNTQIRTVTINPGRARDSDTGKFCYIIPGRFQASIIHFDTTLTKSSLNYVSISCDCQGTNDTGVCKQLTVLGF